MHAERRIADAPDVISAEGGVDQQGADGVDRVEAEQRCPGQARVAVVDSVRGPEWRRVFEAVAPIADEIAGEDGEEGDENGRRVRPEIWTHQDEPGALHR